MSRPNGHKATTTRRELMTGAAATAVAALAAPPILAQTRAPLKLGVLNSYTGAIAVAADSNVIAVTAVDQNDGLFASANQGPHIAVAAPGVDILEPAPNASYQVTTGTSVAAAHVSGIAALMIERDPSLDPKTVHEILTSSAKPLRGKARSDEFGWGLVDPARALLEVDVHAAYAARRKPTTPRPSQQGALSAR